MIQLLAALAIAAYITRVAVRWWRCTHLTREQRAAVRAYAVELAEPQRLVEVLRSEPKPEPRDKT
jgi:hypothetical protein